MAMWSDWASVAGIAAQYIGGDLALQQVYHVYDWSAPEIWLAWALVAGVAMRQIGGGGCHSAMDQ